MQDNYTLVIVVPIEVKDELIDAMMELTEISGFSMSEIAGYSREHAQYSLQERVQGYRTMYRFEILHTLEQRSRLLQALKPTCQVANARYWITPVVETGHFMMNKNSLS